MGKKLLVILGAVAVAGYLFRDRIAAGALALVDKANSIKADLFTEDETGWDAENDPDASNWVKEEKA